MRSQRRGRGFESPPLHFLKILAELGVSYLSDVPAVRRWSLRKRYIVPLFACVHYPGEAHSMPRTRTETPPKYRHHKARNLAKVSISRRDIYLGPYNSPESHQRYAQVIAAWQAGRTADEIQAIVKGTAMPEPDSINGTAATITVGQLAKRFWTEHAAMYYTSSTGMSRGRTANVKVALRAVNDQFAAH